MIQLTDEQVEKVRQLILNPPPNSKTAAAKDFGIDLTLLIENLRLTPQERIEKLQDAVIFLEEIEQRNDFAAKNTRSRFGAILQSLLKNKVDFVIVGELACFVHGWRHIFLKLEILYSRATDNPKKTMSALASLRPRLRGFSNASPFIWEEETLLNKANLMIETDAGSIDLLGEIAGVGSYIEVFKNSMIIKLFGDDVRVLSLDDLIKAKKAAARPKDLFVLPQLETLREALSEKTDEK